MFVVDISDEVVQQETPAVSAEQAENQEQTEPVEHEETLATSKRDKPATGGRRNRAKKESEDK